MHKDQSSHHNSGREQHVVQFVPLSVDKDYLAEIVTDPDNMEEVESTTPGHVRKPTFMLNFHPTSSEPVDLDWGRCTCMLIGQTALEKPVLP